MQKITFNAEEKAVLVPRIQMYLREEMDVEAGSFAAEFLLDFFTGEVGAYFYNRGLYDAQAVLEKQVEELGESIYQLEQPTEFSR